MSVLLARHHRQRRLRDPNRDRAVAPPHDDDERLPGDTRGLDRNVGGRKPAEDRRERRSVDRPSCENRGVTTLRDDRCATDAEEGVGVFEAVAVDDPTPLRIDTLAARSAVA